MKVVLKTKETPYGLMRKLGYRFMGQEKDELVFSKALAPSGYPRFHIYLKAKEEIIINLHLDQKKPIYKGAPAHSAEYEGKVVEKEAERIKEIAGL